MADPRLKMFHCSYQKYSLKHHSWAKCPQSSDGRRTKGVQKCKGCVRAEVDSKFGRINFRYLYQLTEKFQK